MLSLLDELASKGNGGANAVEVEAEMMAYFAGSDGRISTKEFIDKMDLDE